MSAPAPGGGKLSRLSFPTGWLLGLAVMVTIVLLALVGLFLRQSRVDTIEREQGRMVAWSESMGAAVEHLLFDADLELAALHEYLAERGATDPDAVREVAGNRATHEWLRAAVQRNTSVGGMFVVDDRGRRVATQRSFPSDQLDLTDRPYFRELRDRPGAGTLISPVLSNRNTAIDVVFVVRRLEDEHGRFLGLIAANLPLPKFTRLFDDAEGAGLRVALVRRSGELLLTGTATREAQTASLAGWREQMADALAAPRAQAWRRATDERGDAHLVALRELQAYPLALLTVRPMAEVLSPWREQANWIGGVAAAALVLLWGAAALGARQVGLQRAVEIAEAQRELNTELQRQVAEREAAQRQLADLNHELEERIARRTEQLQRALERAEEASAAKTRFLSHMSHELRTPMNAVLGFAELLSARNLDAQSRHHLELIRSSGSHLLNLIGDVLDLSRIEAEALELRLRPVRLAPAVRQVAASLADAAARRRLHLAEDPIDPTLAVQADPVRLQQVLVNLLSNAIKYNAEQGRIRIAVGTAIRQGGEGVWVDVHDTGRGLTADQLDRVFEPFERLGAELSSIEGSGVGLTISRRLAEAMGGRIEVESTPGVGSCFRLWLPRATAEDVDDGAAGVGAGTAVDRRGAGPPASATAADAAVAEPTPLEAARTTTPLRVLYAEDNEVNALLLRELCRLRGDVHLRVANSGAEALAAVRAEAPELLLLDMHLGDMTGLELLQRLREQGMPSDTRCVALSADAMRSQIDVAKAAGLEGYLTKPLHMQALFAVFDETLATRGRRRPPWHAGPKSGATPDVGATASD